MSPALAVLALWVLFGGTHMLLSSTRVRPHLVARLGERPFQGLYSLIALVTFVVLVRYYGAHRHEGALLWALALAPPWRELLYLGNALALVLAAAGVMTPSPATVLGGPAEPRGVQRLTRHALFMGMALWALMHLAANGFASDVAFFGGFAAFSVIGAWHQDRRKLAGGEPTFAAFHAATPFWPLTGRETLRGLRELSPVAVIIGLGAALGVRLAHPWLFG